MTDHERREDEPEAREEDPAEPVPERRDEEHGDMSPDEAEPMGSDALRMPWEP